jgi:putative transposase
MDTTTLTEQPETLITEAPISLEGLAPAPSPPERNIIVSDLSPAEQMKLAVIQILLQPTDRTTYGQRLREGAMKLDTSVRSVQRMFKKYQIQGLEALIEKERVDSGQFRISEFWQDFIVKTYKHGNKGSRRMTPKQVSIQVQAKAREIKDQKPPKYRTVLRVIAPLLEEADRIKKIRSPGWRGSTLSHKTRDGKSLDVDYSNKVWQSDHTRLDVMLVDQHGVVIGRPWLTTVIDSYSRAIIGINIGFDAPSSQVVALALRHAVLPKSYGVEYRLHTEWITYGKPEYLFTDGGKDFRSNHLQEIGTQLGFVHKLRDRPSEGGIVERFFKTLNESVLRALPGYTGSNVQQRPEAPEKDAKLTLRDMERVIVGFIVDSHNQDLDARMGDQSRNQRWDSGLISKPPLISERELDICLMKIVHRTIQRGGFIQFENVMFRGDFLSGRQGSTVSVRYDPRDIRTIWVYHQQHNKEVFLTHAHAQGLETEQLSLEEAKASSKRIRDAGKAITNQAILYDVMDWAINKETTKPSRKQRQKNEQSYKQPTVVTANAEEIQSESIECIANIEEFQPEPIEYVANIEFIDDINTAEDHDPIPIPLPIDEDIEVWDYEQIQNNYGW